MAASKQSQGYKCEFISSVPEDFYCKECTLVARGLVMTDCCGESYCHGCITHSLQQGLPCPACGEQNFTVFNQNKYRNRIKSLKVYCSLKERGCVWSGTLDHLDAHLDPELDNCQYVDTKCPLNCPLSVPRNMVDQHVAQQCARRPHVCQHCGFKAPYQELVDTHLPQCKYVPLTCPNRCGVTCERDFLEDHMKMCRLEEIHCEFRSVGCNSQFIREDKDKHIREKSHKHLTLTASLAVQSKEQLLQKLLELDKKHKEVEAEMKEKLLQQVKIAELQKKRIDQQEKKLEQQEKMLNQQLVTLEQQQVKLEEHKKLQKQQEQKYQTLEHMLHQHYLQHKEEESNMKQQLLNLAQKLVEQENFIKQTMEHTALLKKHDEEGVQGIVTKKMTENQSDSLKEEEEEQRLDEMESEIERAEKAPNSSESPALKHTFEMRHFSVEKKKKKTSICKSPAMYTHVGGYKFCIGVDANGYGAGMGRSVNVDLWTMPGEYDGHLKWPVTVTITLELINQQGGNNAVCSASKEWTRPKNCSVRCTFKRYKISYSFLYAFLSHSELDSFLLHDTLYFHVSNIELE